MKYILSKHSIRLCYTLGFVYLFRDSRANIHYNQLQALWRTHTAPFVYFLHCTPYIAPWFQVFNPFINIVMTRCLRHNWEPIWLKIIIMMMIKKRKNVQIWEKSKVKTGDNPTEQSSCSFTILHVLIYTIRYSFIKYLAGLSFAKQSFIQIQNAPSVGLCQRTWRLSTASALEDISQFKTLPRFWQTQAKGRACEQYTVGADWLLQSGSVQFTRPRMEQCEGAVDHEVCESHFFCPFILLFLCHHPRASLAPDRPAGLVVSPFLSPAARHSRSQVTLRGRTEETLEGKTQREKEGGNEGGKQKK